MNIALWKHKIERLSCHDDRYRCNSASYSTTDEWYNERLHIFSNMVHSSWWDVVTVGILGEYQCFAHINLTLWIMYLHRAGFSIIFPLFSHELPQGNFCTSISFQRLHFKKGQRQNALSTTLPPQMRYLCWSYLDLHELYPDQFPTITFHHRSKLWASYISSSIVSVSTKFS